MISPRQVPEAFSTTALGSVPYVSGMQNVLTVIDVMGLRT